MRTLAGTTETREGQRMSIEDDDPEDCMIINRDSSEKEMRRLLKTASNDSSVSIDARLIIEALVFIGRTLVLMHNERQKYKDVNGLR